MTYTEQLHAAQRAQLDWALEARAALADWRATEPPEEGADPWADHNPAAQDPDETEGWTDAT